MKYLEPKVGGRIDPVAVCVLVSIAVVSALFLSGCTENPYTLAPVHGRVTLDGRNIENAKVMFAPISQDKRAEVGRPAFGLVQADGSFVLSTYAPNDGAVIGQHWVTVIRLGESRDEFASGSGGKKESVGGTEKIGPSSWSRVTYPERVNVSADGENEFTLALTSEHVAKYGQLED